MTQPYLSALLVVSDDTGHTHLVGSSPALTGSQPTDRDTLCGAAFATDTCGIPVAEVDCGECLMNSQQWWGLPSWGEGLVLP